MTVATERVTHWPIVLRQLQVAATRDITPRMRRVTLTGDELRSFERDGCRQPEFRSVAFDDHIKLFFPQPGSTTVVLPEQGDGRLHWPTQGPRPVHRNYTVRRVDVENATIDVDFVRHAGGVASAWADRVQVGDVVHIAGPKMSTSLPADVAVHLLVADETALPAIARYAEERTGGARAVAVIEVAGPEEEQVLGGDVEVVWVHRSGPSGPSDLLANAVRALDLGDDPSAVFAWVAGEHGSNQLVRRHLADERAIPATNIDVTGYWRRGATDDDHDELHDLADLLTPMAIRVAATLGLPDHIAGGATTIDDLAAAAAADPVAVSALVRYLATKRVFTMQFPGVVGLGPLGELLRSHSHRDEFSLDSSQGHMEQAWFGLLDTARTGGPGYPRAFGIGFWDHIGNDQALAESFDEQMAEWADIWIPHVVNALDVPEGGEVIDVGGGTGRLLAAVLDAHPALRGAVVELGPTAVRARDELQRFGERARAIEGSFFDPLPSDAHVYILAQVLHDWPDDDAQRILSRCADAAGDAGSIVLIERVPVIDAGLHDHLEMDLLMLNLFGSRERTDADYDALAAGAGLAVVNRTTTPVGLSVLTLRRQHPTT